MELATWAGVAVSFAVWISLTGYTLYRSVRAKRWNWTGALIINIGLGLFFPIFVSIWLPISYLILVYNRKERKIGTWEYALIVIAAIISLVMFILISPDTAFGDVLGAIFVAFTCWIYLSHKP